MINFFFLIWFIVKITLFLFFWLSFLSIIVYIVWEYYDGYWLVSSYLYIQEAWDNWDMDLDDLTETTPFLMWELNISSISDEFWNFWDDGFYPWDNYLYPEFRYFFIYSNTIVDIWN